MALFVALVLISATLYPLSVVASSSQNEYPVEIGDHGKSENRSYENPQEQSQAHNQEHNQGNNPIAQTGPDEGDNRHPSGKDRSEEMGNSQTQGKSQSDPDEKENAYGGNSGNDKIGYDGGSDKGDQDGNNGCGNDDDFEDDNNGNCKGKTCLLREASCERVKSFRSKAIKPLGA